MSSIELLLKCSAIADAFHTGNPLVFVSEGLTELTGYKKEEMLGKKWDILQVEIEKGCESCLACRY